MANQIVNRTVNIFIESGLAQKALDALKKKEKELQIALEKATDPKIIAKLKDEIEKLQEPISRAAKKLSGELSPSLRDTQAAVNNLGNRLKRMSTEDADYSMVLQQYRQANVELDAQRGKMGLLQRAMKSFWQEAKTVAVGVIVGNTIQSALQTVLGYVTGIVTGSAKISDELADIQRITGLQKNEVKELNAELKKIDTRTSTTALRDITLVAGKLGIEGKENLLSFVTAVDKLNIAMGGELGDINQFTTDLGKILNVFEGQITGENITAVGNAIVTLANKGVASGPFIVDFTQRVAAIAKTSNLSLDAVVGLAAGLEESGLKVESSATAIQKILTDIASDVPSAARAAGVEVEKFQQLFAEKPQEALLLYSQGLVKNKTSFSEVTAAFKDQGEEGARVISTIATLGQKTDFFREKMELAGGALKDTTAITEAFELKNNTAGAELDKFKKNFASLFQSSSFQAAGETAIKLMNGFVNLLKGSFQFIKEHGGLIATLGTIYVLLASKINLVRMAKIADNVITGIKNKLEEIALARTILREIAEKRKAGAITLATAAQQRLNTITALGAGPLGVLLLLIGALVVGLERLFSGTKKLNAEQRVQMELAEKVSEATGDQVANIERLAKAAANENLAMDERKKSIEELIKINPAFEDTLRINTQGHLEGADSIITYIKALNKKAEAEARTSLLVDKIKRKNALITEIRTTDPKMSTKTDEQLIEQKGWDVAAARKNFISLPSKLKSAAELQDVVAEINTLNETITIVANDAAAAAKKGGDGLKEENKIIGDSIDSLKKKLEDLQKKRDAATDDKSRASFKKQIDDTEKRIAAMEGKKDKAISKADNDLEKLQEELQKIKNNISLSTLSFLERELGELDIKYAKLAERAKGNNKLLILIQELHEQERLQVIKTASRKEVEEFSKSQTDKFKKEEEVLKKTVESIKVLHERLESESDAAAGEFNINRDRNTLAGKELDVLKTKGREKLAAELALLDEQKRQELDKKGLTENEKLLIEERYRAKRQEAEMNFLANLSNMLIGYAGQVLNIYNILSQAQTERENSELERDRRINDKKKQNLANRLKAGTISQLQHDREVQKLDKEQEKREKEARLKQFKRDQRAQIIQALMSGAQGVVSVLAARPGSADVTSLGILRAINIGLTLATTAAQVTAIATKKPPEFGTGTGAFLKGPSHQDKSRGMPVSDPYTGQVQAYLEGGEMIGSKKTAGDKRRYNVEGTPSQIYSVLNGINGGATWSGGAMIRPAWSTTRPRQMNFEKVNSSITTVRKFYATGGTFPGSLNPDPSPQVEKGVGETPQSSVTSPLLLTAINDLVNVTAALNQTLSQGIDANISYSAFEKAKKRIDNIRKDATL